MLVSVLLSDVPHENMGNFTVWPGSHRVLESYCREHGPERILTERPKLEMAPQQIIGRKGDAVICHFQLGHGIAPNVSPHIRYALFFRMKHPAHESRKAETLSNMWLEWPGVHDSLNREG
jgi:ectoine hydroxylase-related dioxygenase (phytanoyl-CoA dioxygenase family)